MPPRWEGSNRRPRVVVSDCWVSAVVNSVSGAPRRLPRPFIVEQLEAGYLAYLDWRVPEDWRALAKSTRGCPAVLYGRATSFSTSLPSACLPEVDSGQNQERHTEQPMEYRASAEGGCQKPIRREDDVYGSQRGLHRARPASWSLGFGKTEIDEDTAPGAAPAGCRRHDRIVFETSSGDWRQTLSVGFRADDDATP